MKTTEEQAHRLSNEKAALINTVRKLNRDVAKLDNFKRNLLNSLQADEEVCLCSTPHPALTPDHSSVLHSSNVKVLSVGHASQMPLQGGTGQHHAVRCKLHLCIEILAACRHLGGP